MNETQNNNKIPLYCPKCHKVLGKLDEYGYCKKIFLYCRSCKQEYEITYKKIRAVEPKIN